MNEYPDHELIYLVEDNNDDAYAILFNKYKYLIDLKLKNFSSAINSFKLERQEIKQELLIAYSKAIRTYNSNEKMSFKNYALLLIDKTFIDILRKKTNKKSSNIQIVELDKNMTEDDNSLGDIIPDYRVDIEKSVLIMDTLENCDILNEVEYKVLSLILNGSTPSEIAEILNISIKKVNNALYRLRKKIKNEIND